MSIRVIEFSEYNVVVPFVCHRCGNCYRDFYPGIEMDMFPEITGLINKPIHEIQARLTALSGRENGTAACRATRMKEARPIPEGEWACALKKLETGKASARMVQKFAARNGIRHG